MAGSFCHYLYMAGSFCQYLYLQSQCVCACSCKAALSYFVRLESWQFQTVRNYRLICVCSPSHRRGVESYIVCCVYSHVVTNVLASLLCALSFLLSRSMVVYATLNVFTSRRRARTRRAIHFTQVFGLRLCSGVIAGCESTAVDFGII